MKKLKNAAEKKIKIYFSNDKCLPLTGINVFQKMRFFNVLKNIKNLLM